MTTRTVTIAYAELRAWQKERDSPQPSDTPSRKRRALLSQRILAFEFLFAAQETGMARPPARNRSDRSEA